MSNRFSAAEAKKIRQLFPEKYQDLLSRAEVGIALGAPFEISFRSYQDFNAFLLMFDRHDFPSDKFPKEFSIGIMAQCPQCGNLNMAGGCDFALIELNARELRQVTNQGGEMINICLSCQIDLIGPQNLRQHCEETGRKLRLIRTGWGEEQDDFKKVH